MFSDMTRDLVESNIWGSIDSRETWLVLQIPPAGSCGIFPSTNLELRSDPYCICKLAGSVCLVSGLFLSISFFVSTSWVWMFFLFFVLGDLRPKWGHQRSWRRRGPSSESDFTGQFVSQFVFVVSYWQKVSLRMNNFFRSEQLPKIAMTLFLALQDSFSSERAKWEKTTSRSEQQKYLEIS